MVTKWKVLRLHIPVDYKLRRPACQGFATVLDPKDVNPTSCWPSELYFTMIGIKHNGFNDTRYKDMYVSYKVEPYLVGYRRQLMKILFESARSLSFCWRPVKRAAKSALWTSRFRPSLVWIMSWVHFMRNIVTYKYGGVKKDVVTTQSLKRCEKVFEWGSFSEYLTLWHFT